MHRTRPDATVNIHKNRVFINGDTFDAELRESLWLVRLNTSLLLPGLRRTDKRVIYLNGKRCGIAEHRGGAIPLQCKRRHEEYFSDVLENRLAEVFGLCSRGRRLGYYRVKIRRCVFIVDVHRTQDGGYHCMLYTQMDDEYIGDFIFDATFSRVYTRLGVRIYEKMFCIVIGYVMSSLVRIALGKLMNSMDINC